MVCEFCVLFAQESRMNKLLTTIVLICFSIEAIAQEKQVWACEQLAGTMLNWEDGSWEPLLLKPRNILVTIDGANSSYRLEETDVPLTCNDAIFVSCLGTVDSEHLYLNTIHGKMGMSRLFGAATPSGDERDTVTSAIYNCTKF